LGGGWMRMLLAFDLCYHFSVTKRCANPNNYFRRSSENS